MRSTAGGLGAGRAPSYSRPSPSQAGRCGAQGGAQGSDSPCLGLVVLPGAQSPAGPRWISRPCPSGLHRSMETCGAGTVPGPGGCGASCPASVSLGSPVSPSHPASPGKTLALETATQVPSHLFPRILLLPPPAPLTPPSVGPDSPPQPPAVSLTTQPIPQPSPQPWGLTAQPSSQPGDSSDGACR